MERVKEGGGGGEERNHPHISFLALSPFSARAKHQKSRSLLPNPTETLATQATSKINLNGIRRISGEKFRLHLICCQYLVFSRGAG